MLENKHAKNEKEKKEWNSQVVMIFKEESGAKNGHGLYFLKLLNIFYNSSTLFWVSFSFHTFVQDWHID